MALSPTQNTSLPFSRQERQLSPIRKSGDGVCCSCLSALFGLAATITALTIAIFVWQGDLPLQYLALSAIIVIPMTFCGACCQHYAIALEKS